MVKKMSIHFLYLSLFALVVAQTCQAENPL